MSAGLSATRVSSTAAAPATPRRPPAHAMSALSASSWRTRTPRLAPSAARTASSRRRDAARANTRPATLPHAISRTRATAAISSHKVCRAGPKTKSSEWRHDDSEVRQVDAKLVADCLQIRRHLAARLVNAHARLQSPEGVEHAELAEEVGARLFGVTRDRLEPRCCRRPVLSAAREEKLRGHYADHFERLRGRFLAHHDLPAHDGRIGAEELRPRRVAEHQPALGLGSSSLASNTRPRSALRSEHLKERAGHRCCREVHGVAARDDERAAPVDRTDQRDVVERSQACTEVGFRLVGRLDHRVVAHVDRPEHHHARGVRQRHRPQQHRMDDAEHGRAGADTHRQDEHGDDREARLATEEAEGIAITASRLALPV